MFLLHFQTNELYYDFETILMLKNKITKALAIVTKLIIGVLSYIYLLNN